MKNIYRYLRVMGNVLPVYGAFNLDSVHCNAGILTCQLILLVTGWNQNLF